MNPNTTIITNYKDACKYIQEIGIFPLTSFIPDHPSLDSITSKHLWYTGTKIDPYEWRKHFAIDGIAAYGKFLRKKSILISVDLFPTVRRVLGDSRKLEERYKLGLKTKEEVNIFKAIYANPGIETRELKGILKMNNQESKKAFDKAINNLQESIDIVIPGFVKKLDDNGAKKGWNSTSYMATEVWMKEKKIPVLNDYEEAKNILLSHIQNVCSEKAKNTFIKSFNL